MNLSDPKSTLPVLLAIFCALFTFLYLDGQKSTPQVQHLDDLPVPTLLEVDFGESISIGHDMALHHMIRPYFWAWDGRAYPITNSDMTWETVKTEYTDLLTSFHFSQDQPITLIQANYERVELMVWRRHRFFGMEGEMVAVAWMEDGENPPQVVIFFGSDH